MKTLMAALMLSLLVLPVQAQDRQSCRELQRACEMKDSLGEKGEGNCRRFREQCGERRESRQSRCAQLRQACLFKRELGERGEGNCRRYREECR
jgi:hypothetical protein